MTEHLSPQKFVRFSSALVDNTWQDDVVAGITADGWIATVDSDDTESVVDESFDAVALPGMVNVHSHAFQRAFAGLSEYRTAEQDSFWTWRRLMYGFLSTLTPDDIYVIARQLYLEMLLAGYTWVGEFHYVHNDIDGKCYADITEMSDAIIRAANDTGIGLCMLPVLYQRGGFVDSPLAGGQARFGLSNDQFIQIFDHLYKVQNEDFAVGMALHSLRAVATKAALEVISAVTRRNPECRIHIHVAEQIKEVNDCLNQYGQRPVQYLFDNYPVNSNWCLIHATHLNDGELGLIAGSGAVAGLCPTTEANLGDGLFKAGPYVDAEGCFAIGSDSHCSVDLREELRLLEYGQRLQNRQRAILATDNQSTGRFLYERAAKGGAKAIGVKTGAISVGHRADFTLVDPTHPAIAGARQDRLMDRLIFCNADDPIIGVLVGGKLFSMEDPEFQETILHAQLEFAELSCRLLR